MKNIFYKTSQLNEYWAFPFSQYSLYKQYVTFKLEGLMSPQMLG
jgi:hypothetical protein